MQLTEKNIMAISAMAEVANAHLDELIQSAERHNVTIKDLLEVTIAIAEEGQKYVPLTPQEQTDLNDLKKLL